MRPATVLLLPVFGLLFPACFAQVSAKPATADSFKSEALVILRSETTYRMNTDGTGERDLHVVMRLQSDGAAQQFGVLGYPYASAYETPIVKLVRVHKQDGTTVDTPASEAIDMAPDVTREAPLYSDLKQKHVPVRSLSTGDTLEYEFDTIINKAETPDQFWGAYNFTAPGSLVVLAEVLTLQVPSGKYVQVWSPNHQPSVAEANGLKTYTWSTSQLVTSPKATEDSPHPTPPKDPDEDADSRKIPGAAWTTFRNWGEVGDWYRNLAISRSQPDDVIRARADEITRGITAPEDQVRALYTFVSTHTRYIGIDFGIGRYQPHTAAEVLANQYGDCKDKDTLLEALLRAKGFSTAPALIGAGIAPVPQVPSPAVFNHVITTVNLPSGRIWLDSTPLAAPYQFLSSVIRDQKALLVPAQGTASLESTPANSPYPFTEEFQAVGTLDADGKLTAKISSKYRDDNEVLVRALARTVAPAEWDKASQYISANTGFSGTTSNTQFKNGDDATQPIVLSYGYARHPFGDWDNHRIVPLFPALEFTTLDTDKPEPDEDIQLGAPRSLNATSRIKLPDGYRTDLPDPIHVKTDFAEFNKTYRFENSEIVVERNIVILKRKLAKADWKQYQKFTKDIDLDGEPWIQLIQPSKTLTLKIEKVPAPPSQTAKSDKDGKIDIVPAPDNAATPDSSGPTNASITDLMDLVRQRAQAGDWTGAKEMLDQVKAKNPNQQGLWAMYGLIAEMSDKNHQEAIEDFRKEVATNPDNLAAVGSLAMAQNQSGDLLGARKTLQQSLAQHPGNPQLSSYLVSLEETTGDYAGALKALEAEADQNPDDRNILVTESRVLMQLNRKQEAAAAAKSALDGTDDPMVLNNAAYELSETGLDLDIAEQASRKSLDAWEEKSTSITTEQANNNAFGTSEMIVACWDTLGWILFQEGKLDDAKPLLMAGWRAGLNAEEGFHVGQLDEAMGHKDEAAAAYALAQEAGGKNALLDLRKRIADSIARLKAAGAKPGPSNPTQTLQDLRTFKVSKPSGVSGWGTFRMEVTTAGVIESQQMSGQQHLAGIKPALEALKLPDLVPPGSKAHLLRSAVVSCSMGNTCEVVLVPNGGLQTEAQ